MKLLLFTKKNNVYNPFIEKCQKLFPNTKIIFPDCHLKRKNKNYNKFLSDIKNFQPDVGIVTL